MRVGFIGAGKVGFSMGRFFVEKGIPVIGYWNRHRESAKEAAEFTGSKAFEELEDIVHDCDVIFLTVPDGAIKEMFQEIAKYNINGKQICHCSGAMSMEEAFPEIHEKGAMGCSIHPLFPVSSKYESYRELSGAFFCLQGDSMPISEWENWFRSSSVDCQVIPAASKIKYHAACAIASNLVCGLIAESLELLETCGFTEESARKAISPLVRSNVEHLMADGPVAALTGPVERCDVNTVSKHLKCFEREKDFYVYRDVTEKLVEVAQKKNPQRDYSAMIALLDENKKS